MGKIRWNNRITGRVLKSGDLSEDAIQKAVIEWTSYFPALRDAVIHIPNEGKRSPSYGNKLKAMGMTPGASDLFIALPRGGYHGAWLELKSKSGRVTLLQKKFLDAQSARGYYTAVAFSVEEAIKILTLYCFEI